METQAEFAEKWIAEYRVRTARTADWLLNHPELPPRKYQETAQQRQTSATKTGITLVQEYEINWNHPRMREALRLYFYNNLRFDDKVNLNQDEAPDDIDINPDLWNDVSQILKQLKYRDLSVNFGMAKYCPQFSSNDIDKDNVVSTYYHSYQSSCGSIDQSPTFSKKDSTGKDTRLISLPVIDGVASPTGRDALRACGSVLRNPALVYQHLAVQYGTAQDDAQISATDINRVPRAKDFQDEFYHGYTGGMHWTQCSASNVGAVTYHNVFDSPAAYYQEYARGMHHKQFHYDNTERVTSPEVTDSQAAFYQEYARRITHTQSSYAGIDTVISPNLMDYPAAFYHKLARGMYREQIRASDIGRVTSPGVQDSQAAYYHEYAKSMFQKTPRLTSCQEERPEFSKKNGTNKGKSILCQELRHLGSEAKGSCPIKQNPLLHQLARDSNSVVFETPSVLMYIQTSQEIAWKRIPLKTDLVMVNGKMIRDFSLKEIKREYTGYTDGEGTLWSLDESLHVGVNLDSNIKDYRSQSHDSAGVKFTTIAADQEKQVKQNAKSNPTICDDAKKTTGSLSSVDSLKKAIREILSEHDLPKQCSRSIRKDEINALEDVTPKAVDKNGNERTSKSKDSQECAKEDYVDIAGEDAQTKSQEEHSMEEHGESIREKAIVTSSAKRKEVMNPQLPDNDVREQTGTICSNTKSSSASLWSAGDFYKSAVIREQEKLECEQNDKLTPNKATQKVCPRTYAVQSQCNQAGQPGPYHKTTSNSDKRMRDSHVLGQKSEERELSRCPNAKASTPELKPKQSYNLLRFVRRKAAHLKSKISALSCRSSIHQNK